MATGYGADEEQAGGEAGTGLGAQAPRGELTLADILGRLGPDDAKGEQEREGGGSGGNTEPEGAAHTANGALSDDPYATRGYEIQQGNGGDGFTDPSATHYISEFITDHVGERPGDSGTDNGFGWLGGPVGPGGLGEPLAEPNPAPADDFGDQASLVRPYAWTRGRTRANHDLKLETLISTTDLGQDTSRLAQVEHRDVSSLCRYPLSVAEVAAKLSIPLGVARVILSDMAELGLISIHRTFADDDIAAHLVLMERVLSGLRRL
jgi:hypothetical protein